MFHEQQTFKTHTKCRTIKRDLSSFSGDGDLSAAQTSSPDDQHGRISFHCRDLVSIQ